MNINKPTQFGPGDTAYTNTVLDNIRGEQNVNGGRNILQELLFNPVDSHPIYSPMMQGIESFKKPFVVICVDVFTSFEDLAFHSS